MLGKLILLYSRRFAAMLLTRLEVCYKKKFVWERINQKRKNVVNKRLKSIEMNDQIILAFACCAKDEE